MRQQDGVGKLFRMLSLVCSPFCQGLMIDDEVAAGRPECTAWPHEKLRAALNDIDNFDGVIDLSLENLERIIVEALGQR